MQLYLPIADLPVDIFVILGLGVAVGIISGMFGIGGGFLITPLLIFLGIPPAVSVATVPSHIAASSFSSAISYWRRNTIDLPLAMMLLVGGVLGTIAGVRCSRCCAGWGSSMSRWPFLRLLLTVGSILAAESLRAIIRERAGQAGRTPPAWQPYMAASPAVQDALQALTIFVSVIPVWLIGFVMGFIGAIMGIGGGFLLVPMLVYVLRVPTGTVIGTSTVLTLVTMISATLLHAATNHQVDAVLALILMVGGAIGAQFGAQAGQKMRAERLRLLLGY